VKALSLVSFVRIQNYNYDALKEAIKSSLDLIHFNFDRNANKIVIKPNMCYYYHPSTGEVTDPRFVSALIDVFRESFAEDSEIFVVESDASAMKCKQAFSMLEYDKMAKEKGVKLVNLSLEKSRVVDVEVDHSQFKFHIAELFYEADLVVNVPKMKYMNDIKITCALKNMFGCNAYQRKFIYHKALNEAVVGINKLIRTDLVVVDGLIVSGEYTKRLNLVMSSEDPVAVDAAASELMGIAPRSVRQVVLASREGIGSKEFSPVGDFSYAKKAFPKKGLKNNARATVASFYLRVFHEE
jgi:uncharacterized protein (DUF362 family)